jgi:hypothetical protein
MSLVYGELESIAKNEISLRFNSLMNKVTDKLAYNIIPEITTYVNPFEVIIYEIWQDFLYYYDIRGIVQSFIGEEWNEKQEKLIKDGVLDKNGDYIHGEYIKKEFE